MDSGSPRNRIDQFYPSKKRKAAAVSPASMPGRSEKGEKNHGVDGSPSAKGTLDSYLVSSQDDCHAARLSNVATPVGESLVRQHSVKRNLALDVSSCIDYEHSKLPVLSAQGNELAQALPSGLMDESSKVSCMVVGDPGQEKGWSGMGMGVPNLDAKRFAAEFLSLYCSGVDQIRLSSEMKEDTHTRHCSLTLVDKNISLAEKCEDPTSEPHYGSENISSDDIPKEICSGVVGSDPSLRKCTHTPTSSMNPAEFNTPGSLVVKACVKETPKSTRGSSSFSPGSAFWNEAIQVADGLCVPVTNDSSIVMHKINVVDEQHEMENSSNLQSHDGKLREVMDQCKSRFWKGEAGMHTKDSKKEVSVLPVKHFDFSFEDNILGESTLQDRGVGNLTNVTCEGGRQYECGSVTDHRYQKIDEGKEKPLVDAVCKRMNFSSQDNISMTFNSPLNEVAMAVNTHKSDEACTPSSSLSFKNHLELNSWLPPEICSIYRKKGISKLYEWQVDCLRVDGVLQRRNLVYCASTSAGKSIVAEILMLRRVISTDKMAILVLPYVSICAEKAEHLERLLEPLGKYVRSYFGNQGGGTLPKDTSVAVCTIEKANSLINRLLEEGRLSEMGIIVIDELHMVGDANRGYLLELMLTKLRYAAGEGISKSSEGESSGGSSDKSDPAQGLQIVGMSATMPNVAAVADWLQAALYQTEFRPVPLEEYIKVGNSIYDKSMELSRTISKAADLGGKDPDHVVELCNEVVQEGQSVLIFCSSRKGCESTARHVGKFLKSFIANIQENDCEFADITSAIDSLRKCPAGLDPILEETLPSGVAFHHAGLTVEEREIIETCYRKGLLRVLTATSTLAAGVNLPARRVIFRQPRIGRDFIDGTRYKQMAGRAGRTGIDTKGESVLICKPEEVKRVMGLLNENCPPLHSCLSEDVNGMTHAILEVVAGGIVQTASDVHRYVRCTLLNSTKPFQDVVKSAQESLRWLCQRKFLEWNEDTKLYSTTPLGRASFGSSLSPEESLIVLADLSRAREGFVLASDLHLVYLVTPINVDVEPDWELYYERFVKLSPLDQSVGNRVGVTEPFLMRMAHGAPIRSYNKSSDSTRGINNKRGNQLGISDATALSDDQTLRVCRRFYVALILSLLVQETPVGEVCEAYKVARGMVQALQENAGRFASMVSAFCERLGWHDLEGLVAKFQNRVSFGVRAEIVELTAIPYVKGSRARALYKAGLRTPLAIAEASVPEIVKALFESSSWATEGSAKRSLQFGVAKKIKNGARKIVLDKADEARVAAFSAYKSLGYDVPQFAPPIFTAASDSTKKEAGSNSGSDTAHTSHSFVDAVHNDSSNEVALARQRQDSENDALVYLKGKPISEVPFNLSTENSEAPVIGSIRNEPNATFDPTKNVYLPTLSDQLQNPTDTTVIHDGCLARGSEDQHHSRILASGNMESSTQRGPINAGSSPGGIDSFLDLWETLPEFYFDIHYIKRLELHSPAPFEIHGIAICWECSPVYYINLPRDILLSMGKSDDSLSLSACSHKLKVSSSNSKHDLEIAKDRWSRISKILGKRDVKKFTWNLKIQIQVLKKPAVSLQRFGCSYNLGNNEDFEIVDSSYVLLPRVLIKDVIDMCIVTWILWPDEERSSNPNLEKEVKKRLSSEDAAAANQSGRWKNQMRRAAHNGCCRRVAQTRALCSVLWKLLVSEELVEVLMRIEIPLVNVLADMELWGIGVDLERCIQARKLLVKRLKYLEKEAYKLAGITFSLNMPADIAKVLFEHLMLPIPDGRNKGKKHASTGKQCLDALRHVHPIVPIIKEHRTMAKLLNTTLGSICSLARLSVSTQKYTLHGHWLQTSTATGRLSMEEPNLQCVEHTVDFKMEEDKSEGDADENHYSINARDFFIPTQDNWLLLTADYSQIELRVMAHFSKDSSLIELLSKPDGDAFTMIAARWIGCAEDSVSSNERDQTKKMVYGILYGMGANSLADHLDCTSDEAAEKISYFKSSFPGVASWLNEVVSSCRLKGYVETLKGRKRFLSKIKFGNSTEKSKAQRQAVNSICQGSAADIIKIAMLRIYSVIVDSVDGSDSSSSMATKFHMLRDRCRISLQVHDELVLEVDPSVIREAAALLKTSMENAVSLLVPLRAKVKVGRTWGSLEAFAPDR
ncbi:hypothetical protein HN51_041855 [Arachis hypogaea]|uniref:Helicase and polymerase-containing protein TEBICHI n=1 Tax=Arachis hypogaea TaxID=3818 RepID=A0A444YUG5_ARAHY|nr:helicase and polymerase-containing protein TEBICHI [Arachis hypogaea]RYR05538.1 hypothetical protein Ahy_B06g085400 isoform B [Arachis hypogaea]